MTQLDEHPAAKGTLRDKFYSEIGFKCEKSLMALLGFISTIIDRSRPSPWIPSVVNRIYCAGCGMSRTGANNDSMYLYVQSSTDLSELLSPNSLQAATAKPDATNVSECPTCKEQPKRSILINGSAPQHIAVSFNRIINDDGKGSMTPSRCPVSFPEKMEVFDLLDTKHTYKITILSMHEGSDSEKTGHFFTLAKEGTDYYCYGNGPATKISADTFKKGHINSTKIIMATYTKVDSQGLEESDGVNHVESSSSNEDEDDFEEDPKNQKKTNDKGGNSPKSSIYTTVRRNRRPAENIDSDEPTITGVSEIAQSCSIILDLKAKFNTLHALIVDNLDKQSLLNEDISYTKAIQTSFLNQVARLNSDNENLRYNLDIVKNYEISAQERTTSILETLREIKEANAGLENQGSIIESEREKFRLHIKNLQEELTTSHHKYEEAMRKQHAELTSLQKAAENSRFDADSQLSDARRNMTENEKRIQEQEETIRGLQSEAKNKNVTLHHQHRRAQGSNNVPRTPEQNHNPTTPSRQLRRREQQPT